MTWQERYEHSLMNTFGTPKRQFVKGEGVYVVDESGRRYLDLLGGIAVNCLGHAHPQFLAALADQLSTVTHVSNFFATPTQIGLAERLAGLLGHGARVFLTNSGTEANEAAFKLTRLTGRTVYTFDMAPEPFWGLWSDASIHAIHLRVLHHIAGVVEAEAG